VRYAAFRAVALAAALTALVLAAVACGGGGDGSTTSGGTTAASTTTTPASNDANLIGWAKPDGGQHTVCYFGGVANNTYAQSQIDGARAAAKQLDVNLKVTTNQFNPQEEVSQLQSALAQRSCDGIVVWAVDPNIACPLLRGAQGRYGIPVVIVTFPICGDDAYTDGTTGFSGSQSKARIQQQADFAFSLLDGGGEVGVIQAPAEFGVTAAAKAAYDAAAQGNPDVKIVDTQYASLTGTSVPKQVTSMLLAHPDLRLILTPADSYIPLIVSALRARGLKPGEVKIVGFGGSRATLDLIKQGWVQGDVALYPFSEVAQGVDMLVAALQGAQAPTVNGFDDSNPAVVGGTANVTQDNVGSFKPEW